MALKQRPVEYATVPVGNGQQKTVEVMGDKAKTRSGVPFFVGRERRDEQDQIGAHIVPSERPKLSTPQIQGFQRAAEQVQPLLNNEQYDKAVGILREVE